MRRIIAMALAAALLAGCAGTPYVVRNRGDYMHLMTQCMAVHPYVPTYEAWDECQRTVDHIIQVVPDCGRVDQ